MSPIGGVRAGLRATVVDAIPDSAISQYPIDEGSGSTLTNAFSGQPDATINGATWSAVSDLEGGYGLDFDGTDDYVDIDSNFDFTGPSTQFTFCTTINIGTEAADKIIWSETDANGNIYSVLVDDTNSDQITAAFYDGSSWVIARSTGSLPITSRIRVGVAFDTAAAAADIYIDATQEDSQSGGATGATAQGNTLGDWTNQDGSKTPDMVLDNPIWYDTALSASEFQDDYDAQPWS